MILDNDETKDRNVTNERTTIQPSYEQLARCGDAGENLYSVCLEGSDTEGSHKMRSSSTDSEYLIPLSQHSEIDGGNENNVYYDSSCAMVDENETADRSSTNDADKYMNISVPIISLK